MSLDPGMVRSQAASPASGSDGDCGYCAGAGCHRCSAAAAGLPEITRVDVLPLQEGDRLIVHVDSTVGMSAGGASRAGDLVRAGLKLDDLPFDVPVLVVSPGIRVEVARPS